MIKGEKVAIILLIFIFLSFSISIGFSKDISIDNSTSIKEAINNSNENDVILLKIGIYVESNILVDKNLTFIGTNNPEDVIIDGNNSGVIFSLNNSKSTVKFINITFINGKNPQFGGAIESRVSKLYVDNCIFINNTAAHNGGAIDNGGNETELRYLLVNNSIFINNYAGNDGGAITTIHGTTDIYNSYFALNSAFRDGGVIRGGIFTTTNIFSCIFDNNYAQEWGGAIYLYPGAGQVRDSIISNNAAGIQGGGFLLAGEMTVTGSIIANNTAEMGGAAYITEVNPLLPANVIFNNNLIYGNDAINGSNIYIEKSSSTTINFNDNDWGNTSNVSDTIDVGPGLNKDRFIPTTFTPFFLDNITKPGSNGTDLNPPSPGPNGSDLNPSNPVLNNPLGDDLGDDSFGIPSLTISTQQSNVSSVLRNILSNQDINNTNTLTPSDSGDSKDSEKNAYDLILTNSVAKVSINDYLVAICILFLIVIILGFGYRRFKN